MARTVPTEARVWSNQLTMPAELSRQVFLRAALGVAGTAVLGACGSTARSNPATTTAPPPDWQALAGALDGRVWMPTDTGYAAARDVFNSRFDDSTPVAIVAATSVGDVQKAMAFAAENGIEVTARSGGHSYVGASAANATMVVDLRGLPGGISYDAGTGLATVPAAATLNSLQTVLNADGRSIPTGSCPSVGVAGLTLGGGLGSEARLRGLTCDALVSASVVLPTGEVVTASPTDHADLFWALRGGGGASWGVVTRFGFTTYPTTDRDVVTLVFPDESAAQVISDWHGWLTTADRAVWSMVNLTTGADATRCSVILATPAGAGPGLADGLVAAVGTAPTSRSVRTLDHLAFVAYFGGGPDAVRPRSFVAGSDIVAEMTPAAARSIVDAMARWPRALGAATAVVESLDGAIGDLAPDATAFPWRRHAACVQWYTETPQVDSADAWLTEAHAAMGANSTGGYVNYLEASTPAARYFGANLTRLSSVRRTHDPAGVMFSSLRF